MKLNKRGIIAGLVVTISLPSGPAMSQALEEIIVTAQRREQSLQEVPISLEAFSGAELRSQGIRSLDELADFAPTVEIDYTLQKQDISIRGYGTSTANLSSDQAAPVFVDGIHYSRAAMIRNAFMDTERVEILRGPQPVFFGQNATVGAFSLISRKPTPEWEADITTEVGNFGRLSAEGGIGGPISDTLGIRVAGKWDQLSGYMTDVVKRTKFPHQRDVAGRVTLQWAPSDNFNALFKFGASDTDGGVNHGSVCLVGGDPQGNSLDTLVPGLTDFDADLLINDDCFSNIGLENESPFFAPVDGITADRGGIIDIREAVTARRGGSVGRDDSRSYDSYLDLNYRLENGIELSSLTGYVNYYRTSDHENGISAAMMINERIRLEDLSTWSQEFRISSPSGGAMEWMVGLYWQKEYLDMYADNPVAALRRPSRSHIAWQDAEWTSAFASMTFNFLDNRASIDLGGRYSKVKKTAFQQGFGATWVFDVDPTPGTPGGGCDEGVNADICFGDDADVIDLGNGTWTHVWNLREVPDVWHLQAPIAMTPDDPFIRDDIRDGGLPHQGSLNSGDQFDPQVVLRYRPSDDLSLYAKWAQAFKVGGFETGVSSLVDYDTAFSFLPEFSENWEVGAKGTFWDGRGQADLSLFWQEVKDLQIETTVLPEPGEIAAPTPTVNAGLMRVRGAEFGLNMALSERLTVGLSGAFLDGKMVEFEGAGCTPAELAQADTGPCVSADESMALYGTEDFEGTIDRSGSKAPRTPDYKFVVQANYWMPVQDSYKAILNTAISHSDGFIDDVESFDYITSWKPHTDWKMSLGFGDMDDTWQVSAWVRNILEARVQYRPEFNVEPEGVVTKILPVSAFRTYGIQFQYNYN